MSERPQFTLEIIREGLKKFKAYELERELQILDELAFRIKKVECTKCHAVWSPRDLEWAEDKAGRYGRCPGTKGCECGNNVFYTFLKVNEEQLKERTE